MKIGVGESDITPPFPHPMAGYGLARKQPHTGVHDPIGVQCVVFLTDQEHVAIVSCEVIGLKADVVRQIRQAIPKTLSINPDRIVITCTHTHGGPVIDGAYRDFLIERVVEAIVAAFNDAQPRTLRAGVATHEEWIGFNRRNLETGLLPVDRQIPFLVVSNLDTSVRALLFHYACHPSVLGPDNDLITADWPGYTRRMLQKELHPTLTVVYLKGTEGNINTGYSAGVSSLGVKIPTRTYETAERVGSLIGQCLLNEIGNTELIETPQIQFRSHPIEMRYRASDDLDHFRKQVKWWEEEVERIGLQNRPPRHLLNAKVELTYARFTVSALEQNLQEAGSSRLCEQIAFRIGNTGFISFPGEFFVESGLQAKQGAKSKYTFPLGITNDYIGYIPTEEAFPEGGYEVACARFTPPSAESWTCAGVKLLNELFPE